MSQTVLLSDMPIELANLPAGDTLAITVECMEGPDGGPYTPVDVSGASSITFAAYQGTASGNSSPAVFEASLGDGVTVGGVDANEISVQVQTTGTKPGRYKYKLIVQLDANNRITFAQGDIILT